MPLAFQIFEYAALLVLMGILARRMMFNQRRRWTPILFRCLLMVGSLLAIALFSEAGLRLLLDRSFRPFADERNLSYRYDSMLGWFPISGSSNQVTACRTITAVHNRQGFRGPELKATEKPAIYFLGDSFVWGFDVEASERFTDKLQAAHPGWSVCNLGVSGYGTDQELLLLKQNFDIARPRVVFLLFCTDNDQLDNSSNVRHGGYYKPYFTTNANGLSLQGVPVPRSERAYYSGGLNRGNSRLMRLAIRAWCNLTAPAKISVPDPTRPLLQEMNRFVKEKGALLVVGFQTPHAELQKFLTEIDVPWLDLSNNQRYSAYGFHWTPEGHDIVAARISHFLTDSNAIISAALQGPAPLVLSPVSR